jgi:hypothetical protein
VGVAYMKFGSAELADKKQHSQVSANVGRQQRATRQILIGEQEMLRTKVVQKRIKYACCAVAERGRAV